MENRTKKTLGRGIDALLSSKDLTETKTVTQTTHIQLENSKNILDIPLEQLSPNPFQPRIHFDENKLQELSVSLQNHGVLEPLLVSKEKTGAYIIIAGERRFRAAKLAKMTSVPAIELSIKDEKKLEIAIIENLQRENLNPIEMAISFKDIMKLSNITQEKLAKKLGISRPVVSNLVRLLSLPEEIQTAIKNTTISQSHARLLLSIENQKNRNQTFQDILKNNLSVKELEEILLDKKNSKKENTKLSPNNNKDKKLYPYEEKLIEFFGTKVKIKGNINKGTIVIDYLNQTDLSRVLEKLNIFFE